MKTVRAQRRALIKRLRRRFDIQFVFWKLEPQQNGTPHFHLVISSHEPITVRLFAFHWWDVCGRINADHLAVHRGEYGNKPAIEEMRSWSGVLAYASKYIAKIHQGEIPREWEGFRWWGVEGEPPTTMQHHAINSTEAIICKRTMRKYLGKKIKRKIRDRPGTGLKIYIDNSTAQRIIDDARERGAALRCPHAFGGGLAAAPTPSNTNTRTTTQTNLHLTRPPSQEGRRAGRVDGAAARDGAEPIPHAHECQAKASAASDAWHEGAAGRIRRPGPVDPTGGLPCKSPPARLPAPQQAGRKKTLVTTY